jgi:hypothetical protein
MKKYGKFAQFAQNLLAYVLSSVSKLDGLWTPLRAVFVMPVLSGFAQSLTDPLYNDTDVATREAIRKNVIQECFFVDTPLQDILRKSGAVEEFLGGTGMMEPFNYAHVQGAAVTPGQTVTVTRPQISSAAKYQEKAYATFVQIEDFDLDVINRPGDTQILDKRALLEANLVSQLNTMLEMDLYRHGQPSAANGGTVGVSDDRSKASNGFFEGFSNGVDPSPDGNVFTTTGGVTRNGAVGQAYNSTPYFCGLANGAPGPISYNVLTNIIAQLQTLNGKPKCGITSPFGWAALVNMLRSIARVDQLQIKEGSDFGWPSINFFGVQIYADPLAPSGKTWNYLAGGNVAAFGAAAPNTTFVDGVGNNTKLGSYTSPTFTSNGVAVATGAPSPTGSNFPSATTIQASEILVLFDPEAVKLRPTAERSWFFATKVKDIPDNISAANMFMRLATNGYVYNPRHGLIVSGFTN